MTILFCSFRQGLHRLLRTFVGAAPCGRPFPVGCGLLDAPLRWFSAGRFRRLRAATFFFRGEKEGKTPPGTRPMGYGCASLRLGP